MQNRRQSDSRNKASANCGQTDDKTFPYVPYKYSFTPFAAFSFRLIEIRARERKYTANFKITFAIYREARARFYYRCPLYPQMGGGGGRKANYVERADVTRRVEFTFAAGECARPRIRRAHPVDRRGRSPRNFTARARTRPRIRRIGFFPAMFNFSGSWVGSELRPRSGESGIAA